MIELTGDALGGGTVSLGNNYTNAGIVYTFMSNANSLEMILNAVAANYYWGGGSSGKWDTTSTNWLVDGTGSKVLYTPTNNALFTNTTTVTLTNAGVQAGVVTVTVTNKGGLVTFTGGYLGADQLVVNSGGLVTKDQSVSYTHLTLPTKRIV